MADTITEMYEEEHSPANEVKGFTKSFQKRGKQKRVEDENITELLSFVREGRVIIGAKVTEKAFKKGAVEKVYVSSNCDEMKLKMFHHYAELIGVDIVQLDIDSYELGQKLSKPFMVSTVCVRS